jgi:ABC-type glycerol-3-phosphate transport system substrate-binding protein
MKLFEDSGKKFTEANPNITVEVITIDQDLWTKVYASVPASTGPTLCKMITAEYFKCVDQKLVLELDSLAFPDDKLKTNFPNHPWEGYGKFVIPEGTQGAVMIYNKEMFAKAGLPDTPPKTWDEFVNAAIKTSVADSKGLLSIEGCGFDDWLPVLNPLYQQGAMVVLHDGDKLVANCNTPEMAIGWEFFSDAAFKHKYWDKNFPYFTEAVGTEKAASTICEAWGWGDMKANYPDVHAKLGAAAPPTPTGEANPYYGRRNSVLGLASMVNRPDDETNAGRQFLDFLYNEDLDSQFALSSISGLVPAHVENMDRPEISEDPFLSLMTDLVTKEYDTVDIGGGFSDVFYTAMDMLIVNQDSVQTVCDYCQVEIQKLADNGDIKYTQ